MDGSDHTQTYRDPRDRQDAGARVALVCCSADDIKSVPLAHDAVLVVGRAASCQVRMDVPSLSREHARFFREGHRIWVEDLGSHNGVSIEGAQVEKSELRIGDAVHLGEVVVLVCDERDQGGRLAVLPYEGILKQVEQAVAQSRRERVSASVLMIHNVAEDSRSHVGHWCADVRRQLRPIDAVGVYGPSRALVVLPGTALESASQAAHRLRDLGAFHVGVASYPQHAGSAGQLLARAAGAGPAGVAGVHVAESEGNGEPSGDLIVSNPAMRELYGLVARIARTDVPVLIFGETGTGKELVARAVHESSSRRERTMRVINCAALPETLLESALFGHERGAFTGASRAARGVFEQAAGSTLFLDEIGELSPGAQAALLRALETKRIVRLGSEREIEVDVRMVAATHRPLADMVAEGTFREDLFHRLNTFTVQVPALRERKDEILPLARHFLAGAVQQWKLPVTEFDTAVEQALLDHGWPGNVRELRNVVERAAAICATSRIAMQDLPETVRRAPSIEGDEIDSGTAFEVSIGDKPLKAHLRELEEALIRRALDDCHGNQVRAAERLQMPRRTLVQRIADYGIKGPTRSEGS